MFNKILCLLVTFALSMSVWAEDLKSVMEFYKPDMSNGFIFISKVDMTLTLVNSQGRVVVTYPIACGENIGQKYRAGDHKTPEGYFLLQRIHDSSNWGHDFHDGNGFIRHAYGPYFLRLQTGFQGIGIHGTHAPASIGSRATEGCIRLENQNVASLERMVTVGMPVIIGPEKGVGSLIASHATRPDLPYWTTGPKPEPAHVSTPAKPVVPRKPKVVDGQIDIDPEKDLVDTQRKPAHEPLQVTPVQAEPVTAVELVKPEQPAQPEQPIEPVTPAVPEHPAYEVTVVEENSTSTSDAPQYEVVVEEVTLPDGTVKYEVRYIRK